LLEGLARRGENIRQLREFERALRKDLQPDGVSAELLFDRMWSSFLRLLHIVRSEARVLTADRAPTYMEIEIPGLPKLDKPSFSFDDLSLTRLQYLALVQRYDSHFSRDFFRAMGLLVAMRDGGKAGLARQLEKTFGKNKDEPTE
jgi:hypothetical protein